MRTEFTPVMGKTYQNRGGGTYRCLEVGGFLQLNEAIMQNVKSLWTFKAVGCGIYEDGTIDWNWSKDGYFDKEGWQ